MATVDPIDVRWEDGEPALMTTTRVESKRARRTPITWVRGGGLTTLSHGVTVKKRGLFG